MPSHPILNEIQAATAAHAAEKTPRQMLLEVAAEAKASNEATQATATACKLLCEAATKTFESTSAGTKALESAPETLSDLRRTGTALKETAQSLRAAIPPAADYMQFRLSTPSVRNILIFAITVLMLEVFWTAKATIADRLSWIASEVRGVRWPPKVGQGGSLSAKPPTIPSHVQETSYIQSRVQSPGRA